MSDTKASAFGTIPALDRAADYLPVLDMSAAAGSNSRNKLITANTLFSSIGTISFRDTSAAFDVTLAFTSSTVLTAGRTLTVDVKNGNRSVRITGDGTLAMDERPNNFTAIQTIAGAGLKFIDDQSAPQWAMTGLRLYETPGTLTDTTSSGTVAAACTNKLGGNTIAASSATTFTDYFSTYVTAPVAGTNVTLTNAWALGADSLYVGTSNPFNITAAGAVTAQNLVTATNAGNSFLALYGATKDGVALAGRNGGTSSYIASITTAALTASRTFTIPAVTGNDTFALLGVAQTFTAANIFSVNGAASTPALSLTGTIFTGGSATTTKPLVLIEPTGTTSTGWSTNGTLFGLNAPTGSSLRIFDFQQNGTSKLYFEGGNLIMPIPASNAGFRMGNTGNWSWAFLGAEGVGMRSNLYQGWASGNDPTDVSTLDTRLYRDGTGILAQRKDTTAQTLRVYGTFTDASNYVRAAINTTSTTVVLACETAGTGADNIDLGLTPAGTGLVAFSNAASADAAVVSTHTARVKFNGTEYKVLLATP